MMKTQMLMWVLMVVGVMCQNKQMSKSDEVTLREQQIRQDNNMTYTNVQTYTFICGRFDDFVLKPSLDHQYKFQMHMYWRKENVYVTAEYKEGQEVRVIVYQDNQRVLLDREFYMTTGMTFQGKKGSTYTVRFLAAGRVTKLISMITSSPLHVGDDLATKDHINDAQGRVDKISHELKALLSISQRNYVMKDQIAEKILSSTKIYMGYEILQVILIIAVAVFQVTSLTRLLKGGSIV